MPTDILQFSGEERFRTTVARLYEALTDPETMAAAIPDLESAERVDERTLRCVLRPGFSFLRGTMKLDIHFSDLQPATGESSASAAMQVTAKGIGTTLEIQSRMRIEPQADHVALHWDAAVTKLQGLVATISKPLIQAAAGQVAKRTWDRVRSRVEASSSEGGTP